MLSLVVFTASLEISISIPARVQFFEEFGLTLMQAIVPLPMCVFTLGLSPVVGGPSLEDVGRHRIS
ncbi:hypothetical protein BDP67DRAFT_583548 [Colletotrichum lupini]|nr:hypothetical protein BDP67DRAFT_583548 [Colletotrichum lupini]